MSPGRAWRPGLLVSIASLGLGACAPAAPVGDGAFTWQVLRSADDGSIVAQQRLPQALVSVMCERVNCQALIVTDARCFDGEPLPVLINSAVESRVTDGRCLSTHDPDEPLEAQGAILLDENNLLLPHIVLGDDAAIAIPMADGSIRVFNVAMAGLRKLLETHQPGWFGLLPAPGELDRFPDPAPDPSEQDDDDADRWRRGLQAI